jgi:N-acyl-D-aspartate/D-glutamate deacylase
VDTASALTTSPGAPEVDAGGLLVTPGFVDIHTHYDGQATWDPYITPSSRHGVATVIFGNCGVGFAPVRWAPLLRGFVKCLTADPGFLI